MLNLLETNRVKRYLKKKFTQTKKNIPSFQHLTELSPKYSDTKQVWTDRYKEIDATTWILSDHHGLKLGQQQKKQWKAYKLMETEKFTTGWKMGQDNN